MIPRVRLSPSVLSPLAAAARQQLPHGMASSPGIVLPALRAADSRALHATPRNDVTALLVGLGVGGALLGTRYIVEAVERYRSGKPAKSSSGRLKRYWDGGFEEKMSTREAALILGVRCVPARSLPWLPC
eukprot:PLAT8782.2.p1 GENE.PLAT8782.2~~PLAT8782.2.p1  ORF type:complete len:130 (+),score=30.43 PLAT8782.2:33-422(+)